MATRQDTPGFARVETFGRYRLLKHLGSGGMASVILAEMSDTRGFFSRRVALKIMHPQVSAEADLVQYFISEARLGGFLSHPNIIQSLDFGEIDGRGFLALEYVDGTTLMRLLEHLNARGEQLPPEVALHILIQVCVGLDYAHRATDHDGRPLKLVHRDLKPANIMLSRHGEIKIGDFGVARAQSNLLHTSHSGAVKGTIRYMSPEQAWGSRTLDQRSDLFAVGAVAFEILNGRPLYRGGAPEILLRLAQDAEVGPEIAQLPESPFREGLVTFLTRALARLPDERFQSAAEMVEALEVLRAQVPQQVRVRAWIEEKTAAIEAEDEALAPPPRPNLAQRATLRPGLEESPGELSIQSELDRTEATIPLRAAASEAGEPRAPVQATAVAQASREAGISPAADPARFGFGSATRRGRSPAPILVGAGALLLLGGGGLWYLGVGHRPDAPGGPEARSSGARMPLDVPSTASGPPASPPASAASPVDVPKVLEPAVSPSPPPEQPTGPNAAPQGSGSDNASAGAGGASIGAPVTSNDAAGGTTGTVQKKHERRRSATDPAAGKNAEKSGPTDPRESAPEQVSAGAATSTANAGTGILVINSRPPSVILLDGSPTGRFPVEDLPAAAGEHTITFVVGEDRLEKQIQVSPGRTLRCLGLLGQRTVRCEEDE